MADRNLNFDPTVTNVTPEQDQTTALADAAGQVAEQAATMSAAGKALSATAATQSQFRQLDSQYRLQNADDPTNPVALQNLQQARQKIVDAQSANVPAIAMRDFTNKTVELGTQSDDLNAAWATKQQIRNGVSNLQTGRVTYLNEANVAGQAFAQDPDADLQSALNYQQAMSSMHQFADPVLGSDKTGAFLKDFNADYAKSFVAGVAQSDPVRAAQLLQDPAIAQHFTTQDIGDMTQVIQKTVKQQALAQSLSTVKNMQDTSDIVNGDGTYYQKRAQLDQGEMDGTIAPKDAAIARRVLTSRTDLDAQTDTPKMATVINSVYDLNASASMNPDDYLVGVKNIQDQVMQMQANNELTAQDAQKLNKEIGGLTSAKLASATNTAGNEFYDANQKFNTLPPEYRGQATRALFYASHGQNMTDAQLSNQANQIIDQVNKQRRGAAQSTLQNLQGSDTAFLQGLGYTPDQLAYTAQKHGMSQQQVIQMLRQNAAKKPATRQAQPLDTGDDIGSTKSPSPDPGILLQGVPPEEQ
jgi:hypothetical protein